MNSSDQPLSEFIRMNRLQSLKSTADDASSVSSGSYSSNPHHLSHSSHSSSQNTSRKNSLNRKRRSNSNPQYVSLSSIVYRSTNLYQAAQSGNLPLCVLLITMASGKRANLLEPDALGNTIIHYAALAQTNEVLNFILSQIKGGTSSEISIFELRNFKGETPLLMAMITGSTSIAKTLVDSGSDPLATDNEGHSVFSILAKHGNVTCLNYMFQKISSVHNVSVAYELICQLDVHGHSVLDWASDGGDINVIEFLIRKGFNPLRLDALGRSALFWSMKQGHLEASRLLILLGCDPSLKNTDGISSEEIIEEVKDKKIIREIKYMLNEVKKLKTNKQIHLILPYSNDNFSKLLINDEHYYEEDIIFGYKMNKNNSKIFSLLIYNHNQSSIKLFLVYFLLFSLLYLVIIFLPYYIFFIICFIIYFIYSKYQKSLFYGKIEERPPIFDSPTIDNIAEFLFTTGEISHGFYFSSMFFFFLYILFSTIVAANHYDERNSYNWSSLKNYNSLNFFQLNGIRGGLVLGVDYFYILYIFYFISLFTWVWLVWISPDPGIVNERNNDFYKVLEAKVKTKSSSSSSSSSSSNSLSSSFSSNSSVTSTSSIIPPAFSPSATSPLITSASSSKSLNYCQTTMTMKPLRSKYCQKTGAVVARMDHYCVWLKLTIGFKNHRMFILFLFSHFFLLLFCLILMSVGLLHDLSPYKADIAIGYLFNRTFFFPFVLYLLACFVFFFIIALIYDQINNILVNITVNEKLNFSRYSWIHQVDESTLISSFDHGWRQNLYEFLQFKDYYLDYSSLYIIPSELTQENVSINSNSSTSTSSSTNSTVTNGSTSASSNPISLAAVAASATLAAASPLHRDRDKEENRSLVSNSSIHSGHSSFELRRYSTDSACSELTSASEGTV